MMLEFWISLLAVFGAIFVFSGLLALQSRDPLGVVLLIFGIILGCGASFLSRDYCLPDDLEIPKTCRQAPIQTSQAGVNFIEVDSEFINLNDKFGRSFENGQIIWIQETKPVNFVSFYRIRGIKMDLSNLQVGDKLRYFYNEGNRNNCLKHVRGYVDEHLILRSWSKRWQTWMYEVKPIWEIEMSAENITIERTIG